MKVPQLAVIHFRVEVAALRCTIDLSHFPFFSTSRCLVKAILSVCEIDVTFAIIIRLDLIGNANSVQCRSALTAAAAAAGVF